MALTHKLPSDETVIYPFGTQCSGFANKKITQEVTTRSGEKKTVLVANELNQDVIDMYIERDIEAFENMFVETNPKAKEPTGNDGK